MARSPGAGISAQDTTAIDFSRLLMRLQSILVTPDAARETKLRTSSYEREKVGHVSVFPSKGAAELVLPARQNLEYARSLLTRLERDASKLKNQTRRQETQADLVGKREVLQMLHGRLQELNELGAHQLEEDESSEGEDLLGEYTPDEEEEPETEGDPSPTDPAPPVTTSAIKSTHMTADSEPIPALKPEPTSTLRARNRQVESEKAELFSGASTGLSTATAEALMTHNRTEQESLTNSLLNMAQALKSSSHSFASALEEEKSILNRAAEGLDKNEQGLEAAQRRMGFLRTYTEGRGWWGRMLMYVWIAGLMVAALVITFVLPKLRF